MSAVPYIGVVGPGEASSQELWLAEEVGAGLAALGAVVVTGGLGGVMEAASRGARSRQGRTLGIHPGDDREAANGGVEIAVATGLGEQRNGHGTLSEVGLALKLGRPVIGLGTWAVHGVDEVTTPDAAVDRIARLLAR